jgi:hypothetical protein
LSTITARLIAGTRALAALCALTGALGAARAAAGELDHEAIARAHLAALGHGQGDAQPSLDALLAQHFVHGRLGLFEVLFPVVELEGHAHELKDAAAALIAAQVAWLDWMEPVVGKAREQRKDLELVAKWIERWKTGSGQGLAKGDVVGGQLVGVAEASESVTAALDRLVGSMTSGATVGVEREPIAPVKLCLMPTRKGFVELLCSVGLADESLRSAFWVDGIAEWTTAFVDDLQVVSLEYAVPGRPAGTYEQGIGMNDRGPSGLEQQVVQLGVTGLCGELFGPRAPEAFAQGLAMNLVIDLYGELRTRIEGDLRAAHKAEREMFVPGGQSHGGVLPPDSAENRWRERQGKDWFVTILHLVQQEGVEAAGGSKRRVDCFGLRSDGGGEVHAVCAPILGAAAAAADRPAPPPAFQGEYAEFLRAYKTAFVHWLRTEVVRKDSEERFARLLQHLADPRGDDDFEGAFRRVYDDRALSSAELDEGTLEGAFLTWLARQKGK